MRPKNFTGLLTVFFILLGSTNFPYTQIQQNENSIYDEASLFNPTNFDALKHSTPEEGGYLYDPRTWSQSRKKWGHLSHYLSQPEDIDNLARNGWKIWGTPDSNHPTPLVIPVVLRHDRDMERAIELGKQFTFVCTVAGGSGTLVAPDWILTAAHVIDAFQPGEGIECDGHHREIGETILIPTLLRDGSDDLVDIGLVKLDQPIEEIVPALLYKGQDEQELTTKASGQTAVIAGTGYFGSAIEDTKEFDGRRRAVTNRIVDQDADWLRIVLNRPPGGTDLEGIQGPGDSGGPLLVLTDTGYRVAGVGSYSEYIDVETGTGFYGAMDYYARVSTHKVWIDSIIGTVRD